jgi:hypothetical protein
MQAQQPDPDVAFVIRALSEHRSRNDIVMAVAQRRKCPWNEAEQFVARVEYSHRDTIKKQQSGILLIIAIGSLIGGIAMLFAGIYFLFQIETMPRAIQQIAFMIVTGLSLIVGSLFGLWQLMRDLRR